MGAGKAAVGFAVAAAAAVISCAVGVSFFSTNPQNSTLTGVSDEVKGVSSEEGGSTPGSEHATTQTNPSSVGSSAAIPTSSLDISGNGASTLISDVSETPLNYWSSSTSSGACVKKLNIELASKIDHSRTQYYGFSYLGWLGADWKDTPKVPIKLGNSETSGCSVARLQRLGGSESNDFYFESETVVNNDDYGLILWVNWATASDRATSRMTYRMLFLKNEAKNTDGNGQKKNPNWKIDHGLWWNNLALGDKFSHYIKLPGEADAWVDGGESLTFYQKKWAGTWKENASTSKEKSSSDESSKTSAHIFKEMVVSPGGVGKSEMLGRERPFGNCDKLGGIDYKCGWAWTGYYYEPGIRDTGWWGFKFYKNKQDFLQKWWEPFQEKKGTWTTVSTTTSSMPEATSTQAVTEMWSGTGKFS